MIKVRNLLSTKNNPAANQFVITSRDCTIFQSYDSIIVVMDKISKKTYLDNTYWNWSRTTSKYRSIFLNESTTETKKRIDSGEYILKDLNSGE